MKTHRERGAHASIQFLTLTALLCAGFLIGSANAQSTGNENNSLPPASRTNSQHREISASLAIPPGTILPVRLNSTLSRRSKLNQMITGTVVQDVPLTGSRKVRAGTKVIGHVVAMTTPPNRSDISLQFDKLSIGHRIVPIKTDLRAMAGFMSIVDAQTPETGVGEGDDWRWQTRDLIGGDTVYGVGGEVTNAEGQRVGIGVESGILSTVSANESRGCRGQVGDNQNPQALWVFSSDACGVYGLDGIRIGHAGRNPPTGVIILHSNRGALKVPRGAGLLLRVN